MIIELVTSNLTCAAAEVLWLDLLFDGYGIDAKYLTPRLNLTNQM